MRHLIMFAYRSTYNIRFAFIIAENVANKKGKFIIFALYFIIKLHVMLIMMYCSNNRMKWK